MLDSTDLSTLRKRQKETSCPRFTTCAVRSADLNDMGENTKTSGAPRKGRNVDGHMDGHGEQPGGFDGHPHGGPVRRGWRRAAAKGKKGDFGRLWFSERPAPCEMTEV